MTTLRRNIIDVSFVISTHNRRTVLLGTIGSVCRCGLHDEAYEILVVDNASTDGTADAVARKFPLVRLFRESTNNGPCAKNVALAHARGRFVVFLDDDSYPRPGSVARMIHHLEQQPDLGAAVFTVHLPDGSCECSAYPNVFIGCGTGFRREALQAVGGLPSDFFMAAEEYDLSLRLLNAGWKVKTFDDMHVVHLKSPGSRWSRRITRLDVRNNLLLATRYFPEKWVTRFAMDWMTRYYKIAASKRQRIAFVAGAVQGLAAAMRSHHRRPISDDAFEEFAKVEQIKARLRSAQEKFDLQSVLLIDLGKNILPYWIAARQLGITVVAIADEMLTRGGTRNAGRYRGIPIIDDEEARTYAFDAAIVSNTSPVHAKNRRDRWRQLDFRPVIDLFEIESRSAATREAEHGRASTAA